MIQIEVVLADALSFPADVLAVKYAQYLFGVDRAVVAQFESAGIELRSQLPTEKNVLLVRSNSAVAAREVLFVGVVPLGQFDYGTIREFARSVLSNVSTQRPLSQHIALTMHGAGFGLDEAEAFRSEIAGLLDALAVGQHPRRLTRISIVERDAQTALRLATLLKSILPTGTVNPQSFPIESASTSLGDARTGLGDVGHDYRQKPHIFVAMPFSEQYTDRFHYGIQGAVNAAGYLCERADLASFTGDVLAWVKDRIGNAALVIADLTSANPNVYLEVGYAWGRGVNTVLLIAEGDELKFDVRTQRCLMFRNIRHLEELLAKELKSLRVDQIGIQSVS
jgi:hypothetical protein